MGRLTKVTTSPAGARIARGNQGTPDDVVVDDPLQQIVSGACPRSIGRHHVLGQAE